MLIAKQFRNVLNTHYLHYYAGRLVRFYVIMVSVLVFNTTGSTNILLIITTRMTPNVEIDKFALS